MFCNGCLVHCSVGVWLLFYGLHAEGGSKRIVVLVAVWMAVSGTSLEKLDLFRVVILLVVTWLSNALIHRWWILRRVSLLYRVRQLPSVFIWATRGPSCSVLPLHHYAQLLLQHSMLLLECLDHERRGWEPFARRSTPGQFFLRLVIWHDWCCVPRVTAAYRTCVCVSWLFRRPVDISVVVFYFGFSIDISVCLLLRLIVAIVTVL